MLSVSKVNHYYRESHTLWDLDLDIKDHSVTCLMGRNGVGKTTLLKCIMGLEKIRDGDIQFKAQSITALNAEQRAVNKIAYVPQGREIFSSLTVAENLQTGMVANKTKKIPALVFELFPVLQEMLDRRGGDLSGGQQQQLALGRALTLEPELLILDEPTEGIQPNIVHEIGDIITQLNQQLGLTVLLVEQKLPFARRVASDFCILEKGRNVAQGEIAALDDRLINQYLRV
ncbi:MAG: urea ABC transporter ATP-binding subunit UrtE [Gammaproteobacteria bacterium TMED119]|nr:MAG: urea ABC transporter ATP-binding subunit UrtE [Gammaproteobacteria bacterium TMED119]|tara:strand:+ start:1147 stop:1836 length:690 start_codon:yes stop_codon:yes gene_type:complete